MFGMKWIVVILALIGVLPIVVFLSPVPLDAVDLRRSGSLASVEGGHQVDHGHGHEDKMASSTARFDIHEAEYDFEDQEPDTKSIEVDDHAGFGT